MKRSRSLNFLLAVVVGLMTGTPGTSLADDTEIYLGSDEVISQSGLIRPNVLFILDTSGSMSAEVENSGKDRLEHMQDAFNDVMDSINNVNVGLMRFTDPGGPILFPVAYIDEDVEVAEQVGQVGLDVNVRVAQSDDDAEEIVSTGPANGLVDLGSQSLDLVQVSAAATTLTPVPQVSSQAHNAEERLSNGYISTGNVINLNNNQVNALYFDNVSLPAGAVINDARIVFTSYGNYTGSPRFVLYGELTGQPNDFPNNNCCWNVASRTKTTAFVPWSPPSWSYNATDATTTTPNIASLVTEIVNDSGWAPGDPMVFIQTFDQTSSGERGAFTHQGGGNSKAAKLLINYTTSATNENQLIGMRFQDVSVPRNATITNAFIEFYPTEDNQASNMKVAISAENSGDTTPFRSTSSDLSSRSRVGGVDWQLTPSEAWVDADTPQQTPDIASLVQSVVNHADWCGNNSMSFFIEQNGTVGPRLVESFDGDATRAPILRIEYDEDSVASNACINSVVQRAISTNNDDAEEDSSESVSLGGYTFNMKSSQTNALRFQDLPIAQGAQVIEAELLFTVKGEQLSSSTITFQGEAIDNAPALLGSSGNITDRTRTVAAVNWSPNEWELSDVGTRVNTADIAPVIQEIVNQPGWAPNNDLVIIQTASGAERKAYTHNDEPINSVVLRLKVQGAAAAPTNTVRTRLKQIVDNFDHEGYTPIVDVLYEAARYLRGDEVHWGKTRGFANGSGHTSCASPPHRCNSSGSNEDVRRNTRVSHPASYVNGTVVRDAQCTESNLNSLNCITEEITGSPKYVSPITESCQDTHIILLTDGSANHNDSASFIRSLVNASSCEGTDSDEECALELVRDMAYKDQNPDVPGDQYVITHTIGFNTQGLADATSFLQSIAAVHPDGTFSEATNAANLADIIRARLADALSRTTSFASPSLSVNAFNKLFHRSDVYFSLFKPRNPVRWEGNVKKYQLCSSTTEDSDSDGQPDCDVLGSVLDASGAPAIDAAQLIKTSARSFWSSGADGNVINQGGAGNEIPVPANRVVYTYTGTADPSNVNLSLSAHAVVDANDDGILDGIATEPNALERTQILLGLPVTANAGQSAELIDWIRGMDVDDEDDDDNRTEARYAFNDPLHSSPVAITFGGDQDDPVDKIIVGTNDGGIRLINARNGIEEWIFYPQATLSNAAALRANGTGDHLYGIDATPQVWIYDDDDNGIIEPAEGDFVRVFIGQRRGGDNVYALDLTPADTLVDPESTSGITPKLMWKVSGPDTDPTTDFTRLGQTWSAPRPVQIPWGTGVLGEAVRKSVVIMAGGYDASRDTLFGPGGLGNAIYIIDAYTGARIFTISGDDPGPGSRLVVPDMKFPIPSDIAMFDAFGEHTMNRMYVGDTGGQMWRVDIRPNLGPGTGIYVAVGKTATVSYDAADDITTDVPALEDQRKFFYPPDVVQVSDPHGQFSSTGRYDLLVAVTGRRPNPLEKDVEDGVYAIRDFYPSKLELGSDTVLSSGVYALVQGPTATLTGDLFDVSDIAIDPDDETQATELDALQEGAGWFINFPETGEKGLAAPVVIAGKLFFTTYLPEGVVDFTSCALAEGAGRLYGVSVLSGAPVFNWDTADNGPKLTVSDRVYTLGAGIPSSAVPIFQEEGITLLIGGGGGATTVDPDVELPRGRTYWYEQ